jgi:FkbM family methyltransferase
MNIAEWEPCVEAAAAGVVSSVLAHLPDGGTFVDIGANVGSVSKAVLQHRAVQVYAFEPMPAYYQRCVEVLGDRATVEQLALGAAVAEQMLWCDDTNLGWNTFVTQMRIGNMSPTPVHVVPFDLYAAAVGIDRIDVVKIDVEGYEYAVLAGMHQSILRFHPVIVVELGWGRSNPHRVEQVAELEWLFAHGYERVDYDFDSTTDVVLVPNA